MKYKKLLNMVLNFINSNEDIEIAENFCNEFMENYYNFQEDLEQEVTQNIYELFDDINIVCDSYESNEKIREMDKYCIDEIELRNKVLEIYNRIAQYIC